MDTLQQALHGGLAQQPGHLAGALRRRVLVVGAAGPLGGAVLQRLLTDGAFTSVLALVHRPIDVALAGLGLCLWPSDPAASLPLPAHTDTAVLVFDREGSRHGREAAFVKPQPADLLRLAAQLQLAGVQHLVLVLPHAPGLLPQALRAGLASLDEQAVAALGFEHLVLVRPTRSTSGQHAGPGPHGGVDAALARLAQALLGQLHWLLPQREQPLRAAKLAELVASLLHSLPAAPAGTRVLAPETLWDWAQPSGGQAWLQAWLHHQPLPVVAAPTRRW